MSYPVVYASMKEALSFLPQERKSVYEAYLQAPPSRFRGGPLVATVIIGTLVALGGIALLLAAKIVLPQGLNSVSRAHPAGEISGSILIVIGVVTLAIGSVVYVRERRRVASYTFYDNQSNQSNKFSLELQDIVRPHLEPDEVLVVETEGKTGKFWIYRNQTTTEASGTKITTLMGDCSRDELPAYLKRTGTHTVRGETLIQRMRDIQL